MADETWTCRACGATYTTEPYCWRCKRPGKLPTADMRPPRDAGPKPTLPPVEVVPTAATEVEHAPPEPEAAEPAPEHEQGE